MIKIYMNHLSWNVGKSTDVGFRETFKILEKEYSDIEFYYPQNKFYSLLPNIKRIIEGLYRRIFRKQKRYDYILKVMRIYNFNEYKRKSFDIIYSQGIFPKGIKTPILFDSFLIPPEETEYSFDNHSIKLFKDNLNKLKMISQHKVIINLRSDYSINLAKKIYPEAKAEFVNIPFILPDLKALSDKEIIDKHKKDKIIKLQFTGAQARRKGLPVLIDALSLLYKDGYTNWQLNVISSFDDGNFEIPKYLPINILGQLTHEEVINISKSCHFYTMISYSESFGISYIEALANGSIPLVRNFEPQREIVNYGEFGFLAKPESKDIYMNLKKMLQMTAEQRIRMAISCKNYFQKKYSYEIVIKKWHDAFLKTYKME